MYSVIAHENERQINCSVPFHPQTKSKLTGKIIEICNKAETGKIAYANWNNVYSTVPKTPNYTPCAGMDIFLGLPHIGKEPQHGNGSLIKLYFKSHVKVKSMIMYYDFAVMVADIGGYIGLFLGMSLVDLTMKCNTLLFSHVTTKFK